MQVSLIFRNLGIANIKESVYTNRRDPKSVLRREKMKKFNKIQFLASVGLLDAQFDYVALKFESSTKVRLKCYLNTLLKALIPFKVFVSTFFAHEDPIQL